MLTARPHRTRGRDVWLPKCNSIRTTLRQATPEVWFRIVHVATHGPNDASGPTYGEQTVEIALGPNGAFQDGNVAALTRRAASRRLLTATPPRRAKSTSGRVSRTPRVVELLRKAHEWHAQLKSGEVANQAAIAAREGITRARVTQVMGMLRLAPAIQEQLLRMPPTAQRSPVTERALRPILRIEEHPFQIREYERLLRG